jgi:hypothetical protein
MGPLDAAQPALSWGVKSLEPLDFRGLRYNSLQLAGTNMVIYRRVDGVES